MERIRFKLEDRIGALEAHYENDNNLVAFNLEDNAGEIRSFKLHKIQILALIKAINEPLGLGLQMKK
jgi:hypothetical protein